MSVSSADYTSAGQVAKVTLGNGVIGQFQYNDHLQISGLRYYSPNAPTGSPDVLNLSYDYTSVTQANNNGQIQAIHYFTVPGTEDLTKSESFSYDPWSRLAQAQTLDQTATGTWNLQWTYDRLGNRLSQGGMGNGVTIGQPNFNIDFGTNRIIGYCYDNAGNLTDESTCPAPGTPHRYAYDGANRLISVNNGTASASYSYFGPLRIKKQAGGATTRYVYSGTTLIAEYPAGSSLTSPTKEYVNAGSRTVATIAGTSVTYHHPDHLSDRAETDSGAVVSRRVGQFPFGETWYESGAPNDLKFSTYTRDTASGETGLDYAIFRHYASGQARFTAPDLLSGSIQIPQSMNRYSYSLNDPVSASDPLGLCGKVTTTTTEYDLNHNVKSKHTTVVDEGPCPSSGGGGGGGGVPPSPAPGCPAAARLAPSHT